VLGGQVFGNGRNITFQSAGTYDFEIEATDDEGASATRAFSITAENAPGAAPVVAGANENIVATLKTGSPILVMQEVNTAAFAGHTVDTEVTFSFDYSLEGIGVAGALDPANPFIQVAVAGITNTINLTADNLDDGFVTFSTTMLLNDFTGVGDLLEILFDGPSGSELLIDNLAFSIAGTVIEDALINGSFDAGTWEGFLVLGSEGSFGDIQTVQSLTPPGVSQVPLPLPAYMLLAGLMGLGFLRMKRSALPQ